VTGHPGPELLDGHRPDNHDVTRVTSPNRQLNPTVETRAELTRTRPSPEGKRQGKRVSSSAGSTRGPV